MNLLLPFILALSCYVAISNAFKEDYEKVKRGSRINHLEKKENKPSSCTPEYERSKNHTMCWFEDSEDATDVGVSEEDIEEILSAHNAVRGNIANDTGVEAADMQKMYWDEKIAIVAQKFAQSCKIGHDTNRRVPGYGIFIGQNVGAGQESWTDVTYHWYGEVKDYTYGAGEGNDFESVGHFTQVAKNSAARIGCGFANCNGITFYVCNYATGNVFASQDPYTEGKTCSACNETMCSENQCDCGGHLCLNGGTLDLETCTCSCKERYFGDECENDHCEWKKCLNGGTMDVNTCTCSCLSVFKGDECEEKDCQGKEDPYYCGPEYPDGYPKEYCNHYAGLTDLCPVMCYCS